MPYTPTPKRPKKSIKLDRVQADDFRKLNLIYCCEQCSHFNPETEECTIGYKADVHSRKTQMQRFVTLGHMAFCRFIEID